MKYAFRFLIIVFLFIHEINSQNINILTGIVIDNCEIHDNGNATCSTDTSIHGIHICYITSSTISNNRIYNNTGTGAGCGDGGNGIFLYSGSKEFADNHITDNKIFNNRKGGFFTKKGLQNAVISGNHVYGNGQGGIVLRCKLSSFFTIENNIVTDNKGPGIYVGGPGNTLRYNTATDNKNGSTYGDDASVANGIRISREAADTTLIENDVTGNDDTDVYVKKGLTGIAGSNNTYQTTSNYEDYSQDSQVVRGKKVVGRTESFKSFESGT